MRRLPALSRKTWALTGTGLAMVLLLLASRAAFRPPEGSRGSAMDRMYAPKVACELSSQSAPAPLSPCVSPQAPRVELDFSQPSAQPGTRPDLLPPKLIRNAKISLEVKDFPRFEGACRALAQRYGYVADLRISREEDGRRRADLTLRVVSERLDAALSEFKALGTVRKEEVSVEDVTRTYADLEARRATKRTTAARLREIIANRAGKLSDVIEAEQALGQVTEELESMEAQKRALDGQIQYATLRADVFEPPIPVKLKDPVLWEPLVGAVESGRNGLIATAAFLLEALIAGAPWLLLIVLAILGYRRWHALPKPLEEAPEP